MERRGQANVISLLIIIAAVLAVALAMYSYYVNVYASQSEQRALIDLVASYTTNTRIVLESFMQNATGGEYQYCIMASIVNYGGSPVKAYFSVLPVAPTPTSLVVDPAFSRVPVDYQAATPVRRELVWLAEDIDRNGAIDLLGSSGVEYNGSISLPTCSQIYDDYKNYRVSGLSLPPEAQEPGLGFFANITLTGINGPSLLEVARSQGIELPNSAAVPFWNFTIPAFGKVEFFAFITSPVQVGKLSITGAITNPTNNNLIIYVVYPVKG